MKYWIILLSIVSSFGVGVTMAQAENADVGEGLLLTLGADGIQRGTIVLTSYAFRPDTIVISAGRPVELTLKNDSFLVPHNFVITHEALGLHHDISVSAGESVVLQLLLTTPGRYAFYCDKQLLFFPSHREQGMEGVLEVRREVSR